MRSPSDAPLCNRSITVANRGARLTTSWATGSTFGQLHTVGDDEPAQGEPCQAIAGRADEQGMGGNDRHVGASSSLEHGVNGRLDRPTRADHVVDDEWSPVSHLAGDALHDHGIATEAGLVHDGHWEAEPRRVLLGELGRAEIGSNHHPVDAV